MTVNDNKKFKVALFVCHDLVGLLMLNGIVPSMRAMGIQPVIYNTTNNRNRKFRVPSPSLVAALNLRALEEIILPSVEKNGGGPNLSYTQLAHKYDAEYHEIEDVNAPTTIETIRRDADIRGGISVRFLQVFGGEIMRAFNEKGFLWNLHSGLLGDYKGLLLPYRAIENGEKEYGLTLHETIAGIDEGRIILKGALPLDRNKPVMDLYMDTVDMATRMTIQTLDRIRRGFLLESMVQQSPGRYYCNPTPEEFTHFMQRGIFYIDPVNTIRRIANAFTPPSTPENDNLDAALRVFLEGQGHAIAAIGAEKHEVTG